MIELSIHTPPRPQGTGRENKGPFTSWFNSPSSLWNSAQVRVPTWLQLLVSHDPLESYVPCVSFILSIDNLMVARRLETRNRSLPSFWLCILDYTAIHQGSPGECHWRTALKMVPKPLPAKKQRARRERSLQQTPLGYQGFLFQVSGWAASGIAGTDCVWQEEEKVPLWLLWGPSAIFVHNYRCLLDRWLSQGTRLFLGENRWWAHRQSGDSVHSGLVISSSWGIKIHTCLNYRFHLMEVHVLRRYTNILTHVNTKHYNLKQYIYKLWYIWWTLL